jgi:hypothetical protein
MANKASEMACKIYPNGRLSELPTTLQELTAMMRTAYQLGYNEGYTQGNHDALEAPEGMYEI